MFVATNPSLKYSSLREERDVFPGGQCTISYCAPTEREPNSVTLGYKHLAPLGRNPDSTNLLRFKLEFANFKMTSHSLLTLLDK